MTSFESAARKNEVKGIPETPQDELLTELYRIYRESAHALPDVIDAYVGRMDMIKTAQKALPEEDRNTLGIGKFHHLAKDYVRSHQALREHIEEVSDVALLRKKLPIEIQKKYMHISDTELQKAFAHYQEQQLLSEEG